MTRSAYGLDSQPDVDWARDAACRHDPELWFSGRAEVDGVARHVCLRHCPVYARCHSEAQRKRPQTGVEGGLVWIRPQDSDVGQPAQHQPLLVDCDHRCKDWRHG